MTLVIGKLCHENEIICFPSGLEYAIIFPTIWEYLQSLGVDKEQTYWLGKYLYLF